MLSQQRYTRAGKAGCAEGYFRAGMAVADSDRASIPCLAAAANRGHVRAKEALAEKYLATNPALSLQLFKQATNINGM